MTSYEPLDSSATWGGGCRPPFRVPVPGLGRPDGRVRWLEWSSCCSLLRKPGHARPSCEELMEAEEGDRQCGPTDPRPQLPPSRQGLSRIQVTADHGQAMRPLDVDFEGPATRF